MMLRKIVNSDKKNVVVVNFKLVMKYMMNMKMIGMMRLRGKLLRVWVIKYELSLYKLDVCFLFSMVCFSGNVKIVVKRGNMF